MFNWLGNLFPYSDLHSLNLDWILSKMKETATQAAQAIADSAKALAQVIEAKTAAQNAQTAAQNAQTAANKAAGNAASAAANAVQALNAAQTAQETANTAQSAAQTANDSIEALNAKFPIQSADIASQAISPGKLTTDFSKICISDKYPTNIKFPKTGKANINQITEGIAVDKGLNFRYASPNDFLQFKMDIIENGSDTPNTLFTCVMSPVNYTKRNKTGLIAISPFIVIKEETNETYNGFLKMYLVASPDTTTITCKAVFATTPPFNDNTGFVIKAGTLNGQLDINA